MPYGATEAYCYIGASEPFETIRKTFPRNDAFTTLGVEFRNWDTSNIVAVATTVVATHWTLEFRGDSLVLAATGPDGRLFSTREIECPEGYMLETAIQFRISVQGEIAWIALGTTLITCKPDDPIGYESFPQPIVDLAGSLSGVRPRLALSHPRGGTMLWPVVTDLTTTARFAQDLESPLVCINHGGALIALSGSQGEVYGTQQMRLKHLGEFAIGKGAPLAVLAAARKNQFVVVTQEGEVQVFEIRNMESE